MERKIRDLLPRILEMKKEDYFFKIQGQSVYVDAWNDGHQQGVRLMSDIVIRELIYILDNDKQHKHEAKEIQS